MRSPYVRNNRTRAGASRATAPLAIRDGRDGSLAFSPYLLLAKFHDVRGVVLPVPLVKEQQPVHGALAVLRVDEDSCEIRGFRKSPHPPAARRAHRGLAAVPLRVAREAPHRA